MARPRDPWPPRDPSHSQPGCLRPGQLFGPSDSREGPCPEPARATCAQAVDGRVARCEHGPHPHLPAHSTAELGSRQAALHPCSPAPSRGAWEVPPIHPPATPPPTQVDLYVRMHASSLHHPRTPAPTQPSQRSHIEGSLGSVKNRPAVRAELQPCDVGQQDLDGRRWQLEHLRPDAREHGVRVGRRLRGLRHPRAAGVHAAWRRQRRGWWQRLAGARPALPAPSCSPAQVSTPSCWPLTSSAL